MLGIFFPCWGVYMKKANFADEADVLGTNFLIMDKIGPALVLGGK